MKDRKTEKKYNFQHLTQIHPTMKKRAIVNLAIENVVRKNISLIQAKQLMKDTMKDYGGTNWNRIVRTEISMANGVGLSETIQEIADKDGSDATVAILNVDDSRVAPFCLKHSRNDDNSLKYFRLSSLKPPGYNLSRKQSEWKNSINPRHYNCRCTVIYIPDGYAVDDFGSLYRLKDGEKIKIES